MDSNALAGPRTTSLDEFCRAGGFELSALAAVVDADVGLRPGDALLAVGSVVEGLGNSKSDLDLLLLTPHHERGETALLVGRCLVDLRIVIVPEIEELLSRLPRWCAAPWDVTHAAGFTVEERILLHRLAHGRRLDFEGSKDAPRPSVADVARLKLHVARQLSRTMQVDLAGYAESEDYESLMFAAQELLGHAVDGLLAGHGSTNPTAKWRSKLLTSIPMDWEASVTIRPRDMTAAERVWHLHRSPERPERQACLTHALRITSFARAIFVWAERRLRLELAASRSAAWTSVEPRRGDAIQPFLDFDVDFLLSDEDVVIGRLNDFGETLSLTEQEFAIVLLCDGITTAREAEAFVQGDADIGAETTVADGLMSRLAAAGFLWA